MKSVSVITPVYNTSKYLPRCLDSLINQTFSDFELILVNDGSTDNSLDILREYEAKDSRIQVVDKVNEGVSIARNTGIKLAKGEYIMFCDSDDYVHPQWCELLYNATNENPGFLNVFDLWLVDSNKRLSKKNSDNQAKTIDCFESFQMGLFGYIFNKIYNTSILREYQICFKEGLPIGEDVEFNSRYLRYCNGIKYLGLATYYYCDQESSALKKYYHDLMLYHLNCFNYRYPYIKEYELTDYCDNSFGYILPMFENVFDSRNKESLLKKLKFNQKMIETDSFMKMLLNTSEKAIDVRSRKILKKQNYYIYYLFSKLVSMKHKIFKK